MFKNYIKIAWRNLWKNKLFSFINIFGLAIGISCCILIFLYVQNELSYDTFNEKADRIYRITSKIHQPKKIVWFAPTSPITGERLRQNFPEIKKIVRFNFTKRPISYNNKKFSEATVLYSDSTLFDVFTLPMVSGNPAKALIAPYSIVLTETAVKRYFGDEPAMGKLMKFSDTLNLLVTGIIKDIPKNSHFKCDCIISRNTMADINKGNSDWLEEREKNWFNCDSYSYILLADHVEGKTLEAKANKFLDKEMTETKKAIGMWINVDLQPIKDIHLRSHLDQEIKGAEQGGDITYVYIFSATAILILLIACCNFINLSTARSLNRSKEIGLRKVIGAMRSQLIFQFLGESVVFSLIACILSLIFVLLAIPFFNLFIGTTLTLTLNVFWIYLSLICCIGFLAGLYPALLMSSFSPIQSLKGKINHGLADIFFRKGLVVFQFSIAIILIIGTTLILNQLDFIQNKKLGINKEQVVGIELKGVDQRKGEILLKELSKNPKITGATLNNFNFKGIGYITLLPEGAAENELTACSVFSVDENFLNIMQIELVSGRDFSKNFPTDVNEAFIVNEAAVKAYGWKTPKDALGKKIEWAFGKKGKVIGVVKDFNYASLHNRIEPLLIHIYPSWYNTVTLRLKTDNLTTTMKEIETAWKNSGTENPFKYAFLEDDFNSLYKSEQNMRAVLGAFTFLSVLVACLGLFGLAAFTIKQRFKEIGIRKVLGASVSGVVGLLSKDFLKLVFVSIIISSPIAWYAAHKWLQDFAYKVDISWWIFLVSGAMALLIAFTTVCFQALRAASANPVKSLRTE
jgi:putative ABC transport system permease protein